MLGKLVDITPTGAMISSAVPLPQGKIVHLRIELTEDISEKPCLKISSQPGGTSRILNLTCKPSVSSSYLPLKNNVRLSRKSLRCMDFVRMCYRSRFSL